MIFNKVSTHDDHNGTHTHRHSTRQSQIIPKVTKEINLGHENFHPDPGT